MTLPSLHRSRAFWLLCVFAAGCFGAVTGETSVLSKPSSLLTPQQVAHGSAGAGRGSSLEAGRRVLRDDSGDQFAEQTLRAMLDAAEEQFAVNFKRMRKRTEESRRTRKKITKTILQAEFLLPTYPCSLEGRFGDWGDGGKWVCLRHHNSGKTPVVVSVGSNGDTSFEQDMSVRLGVFSHTFDFTLDAKTRAHMESLTYLKFYNAGLAVKASPLHTKFPDSAFFDLPELLKAAGVSYVDIFKIDCEGCETSVFREMRTQYMRETAPFGQILVELHNLRFARLQVDFLRGLEDMGYRMFHAEINPFWGGEGYELAYIHESLVRPSNTSVL